MKAYVYMITNVITNKHYIGKTKNKNVRWSQHKSKAKKGEGYYLGKAINKYGTKNFTYEIIKICSSEEEAYEYERMLVNLFNLRNKKYGYNLAEGGAGGNSNYKVCGDLKEYFKDKYTGSKSVRAKFTDDDVIKILTEYAVGEITTRTLAKKYKCSQQTISRIISGISYSNIKFDRSNFKNIEKENRKRGAPHGLDNKAAKLSDRDVTNIRKLYATGKYSHKKIADKFNVTPTNIYYIVNNYTRK